MFNETLDDKCLGQVQTDSQESYTFCVDWSQVFTESLHHKSSTETLETMLNLILDLNLGGHIITDRNICDRC